MAGIYIHIPYCKVKCHYCDFHFSVQTDTKGRMMNALAKEIHLEQSFFAPKQFIDTIYFGGGTPSIVNTAELAKILTQIHTDFKVSQSVEITVECNPDDLTLEKLKAYQKLGVNRLSIGVQSFQDKFLKKMNRAHVASEANASIEMAKSIGMENITIDLIYGIPGQTQKDWENDLDQMIKLNVPHLSAYSLTIEPNTVFGHQKKKGALYLPNDQQYLSFFNTLRERTAAAGMEHYEISNFAKAGYVSKHNSAYWKGKPYLGIGPSAHSFNGTNRSWNVANNFKYMDAIEQESIPRETEVLTTRDHFNEYLITRIRTKWGITRESLKAISPGFYQQIEKILDRYIQEDYLSESNGIIQLTPKGMFISDAITEDLYCLSDEN